MKGLRICFVFGNRLYSADCYTLQEVAEFLDDAASDFTEDGQLKLNWYTPENNPIPFTWFSEGL